MIKIPYSYFKNGILACYILLIPLYAFFFLIGAKPFHLDTFMQVTQGQLAFRAAIMASIELVVISFIANFEVSQSLSLGFTFSFDPVSLLPMFVLALIISLFSSVLMSRRINKINPIEALKA